MTRRSHIYTAIGVLVVAALLLQSSPTSAATSGQTCAAAKLVATAKALGCQATAQNKMLSGKPADLTKCSTKLAARFSKAEGKADGACPLGDAPSASAIVSNTENSVLTALLAGTASTSREKACAMAKNKAAASYAACIAKKLAGQILGKGLSGSDPNYAQCTDRLGTVFAKQAAVGGCLTLGDAPTMPALILPASSYLIGANLSTADLTGARLTGVDLSGANLTNANLTSADLNSVRAINLIGCPSVLPSGWVCIPTNAGTKFAILGPTANLTDANLTGANLTAIDIGGATMLRVRAIQLGACPAVNPTDWSCFPSNTSTGLVLAGPTANLSGTSFSDLVWPPLNFSNANLAGVTMTNVGIDSDTNFTETDWTGAVLEETSFYGVNLTNAKLQNASLTYSSFDTCNVSGANFAGTHFDSGYFLEAIAVGAILVDTVMNETDFSDSDFTGSDFEGAALTQVSFYYVTSTGAKFRHLNDGGGGYVDFFMSDLTNADLSHAKLMEANLHSTNFTNAKFVQADLTNATTDHDEVNFTGADLRQANLTDVWFNEADFTGADLRGANLTEADLTEATFHSADLSGLDLTTAYLASASFVGANMSGANLAGQTLWNRDFSDANLNGALLTSALLGGADFTGADLTAADFAGANLHSYLRAFNLGGCPVNLPATWACRATNMGISYVIVGPLVILHDADLRSGDLAGVDLHNADLERAILIGANLTGADLQSAGLSAADLTDAVMTSANLYNADLQASDLTGANLAGANLFRINASNVLGCPSILPSDFDCFLTNPGTSHALIGPNAQVYADLSGKNLSGRDLTGILLGNSNLTGTDLSNTNLSGAYFFGTAIGAILSGADLSGAIIGYGSDMTDVDLSGANLTGTNLYGSDLGNADLTAVTWSSTGCPDGSNSLSNGSSPESCCAHLGASVPSACSP